MSTRPKSMVLRTILEDETGVRRASLAAFSRSGRSTSWVYWAALESGAASFGAGGEPGAVDSKNINHVESNDLGTLTPVS
jgi:hypothetical protein